MSQGKSPTMGVTDLAGAIRDGDWPLARRLMAIRLGEAFDQTDSARDLKAITMSLAPLIEACEVDEQRNVDSSGTPLAAILAGADAEAL